MLIDELERRIRAAFGAVESENTLKDKRTDVLRLRILRLLREFKEINGYEMKNNLHAVK
jgi:hypothetical protein